MRCWEWNGWLIVSPIDACPVNKCASCPGGFYITDSYGCLTEVFLVDDTDSNLHLLEQQSV